MSKPAATKALAASGEALLQNLVCLGDLRPGSLVQCNPNSRKPNRRCAAAEHPPHDPRWIVPQRVNGKAPAYAIPDPGLEDTRAQIGDCQRALAARRLSDVSANRCQARGEAGGAGSADETQQSVQSNSRGQAHRAAHSPWLVGISRSAGRW